MSKQRSFLYLVIKKKVYSVIAQDRMTKNQVKDFPNTMLLNAASTLTKSKNKK